MRALDFTLRLAFFAVVPFLATFVSVLFPMMPVVANIALTLVIFAFAEAIRARAARSWLIARVVARQLAFEEHYRQNPPRAFLFYVFYPLLLPYVLVRAETRRELWLFRGLTGGGLVVLVLGAAYDFWEHWLPELHFTAFIGRWILLLVIQTLCIFLFMMPVATTVVRLQIDRRVRELWALFAAAALSVTMAATVLIKHHGHIVSWVTTQRVSLRTKASPDSAKAVQLKALRAVWDNTTELQESTDKEGWVEGDAIDRAEEHLGMFYKPDEAYAFSLHAYPPSAPEVLVLQCHLGKREAPIWIAMKRSGQEVTSAADLPKGVLGQERRATRRPPVKRIAPPPAASSKFQRAK